MKGEMKETRDPAIKLFGKEIPVPDNYRIPDEDSAGDCVAEDSRIVSSIMSACLVGKKVSRTGEEEEKAPEADKDSQPENYPSDNGETLAESEDNPKTPPINEENGGENPANAGKENSNTSNSQQKTLKKPDKILPCPRCNSMDTKFCYYNNYNVNQQRHFCKSCQRYWTAGGTMRNVPVGAGRRKNKNSASHCRHITISDAFQAARINHPDGIHHPIYGTTNGTVLSFGSETPLCESIASGLKLVEKKPPNGIFQNGFYEVNCNGGGNGSDCSSVTTSNSMEEGKRNGPTGPQDLMVRNLNGFASQIPCLQGFPWPYPAVPIPGFGPPGYPFPIYPPPYWNCSIPGAWPVPWMSPAAAINQKWPNSVPNAPNSPLGKHSRNGELLKPSNHEPEEQRNSERLILIPKTLRIDDPDEAAKSSIWATLGIKNDSINRKGLFKAFQPKGDGKKDHVPESLSSLHANPAAMSRSLKFQESS